MSSYRVFFLSDEDRVEGGEAFEAASDAEAAAIYATLTAACSDTMSGFMLWKGVEQLHKTRSGERGRGSSSQPPLSLGTQKQVLKLGESILQNRWRIARSEALQQALAALRDEIDGATGRFNALATAGRVLASAEMATLQLLDGNTLRLAGTCGFAQPFLDYFDVVTADEACSCGKTLADNRQVAVMDIYASPIFADRTLRDTMHPTGVRSVVSSPLLTAQGRVVGVFSAHWRRVALETEDEVPRLKQLATMIAAAVTNETSEEAQALEKLGADYRT